MRNIFTEHPREIGETYFFHCKFALCFSANMFLGALVCFIHAFLPFCFKTTGSRLLAKMQQKINSRAQVPLSIDQKKNCNVINFNNT